MVERYNGASGKIGCSYNTDNMTAVEGVDFQGAKGYLEFENGQQTATIPVVINARSRSAAVSFNMVIKEADGCKFDTSTDGGSESCICHVTINTKNDKAAMLKAMQDRIHSANAIMGHKNWAQQFYDAIFEIGDGDDEDEDGDEPKAAPGAMDYFMHFIAVPWKLLFALVPPVDYCGGWACFCGALVMIAGVTAVVGDMANLVGCCFDILPETAAITFVALGTSLPDTFASMAAAQMDPTADASIGNVVGSNSVNVFLGVGMAWALAAFKWETAKPDAAWNARIFQSVQLSSGVKENVRDAMRDGNAVFVTPAGTLWFNLMIFSVNALFALQHLFARRKRWGGELGGPKRGFMGQYFSAAFLAFQWFIYVTASIVFARVNDGLTYGQIAEM